MNSNLRQVSITRATVTFFYRLISRRLFPNEVRDFLYKLILRSLKTLTYRDIIFENPPPAHARNIIAICHMH